MKLRGVTMKAVVIAVVCMAASNATAEASVKELLSRYDAASRPDKHTFEIVIASTENGFAWANTYLHGTRNQAPLYCTPGQLALTGSQVIDILRRELARNSGIGEIPFGLGILYSLQNVFPCAEIFR